ncbi:flavin monoamine oxidase family protein [Nocardia arthritidis]|uniref:FAD-dependent oxidoreductase n=1 Tax=Nocardia arthritidis TaxID=228602 RepID=A0A6G9YNQ5_9NOCA|nr:NAD(P)/FAD-dependent oxidoreductase [Nocardia arthritidis]QIS14935.1 FAD-dependent oxidoreductase [Nocardia arthritidis]
MAAQDQVSSRVVDVVVVGAGLAGLTAARQVAAAGRSVVVLEARDRVGGRTVNHDLGDGRVTELGGQYVGPTQGHVLALAEELGVGTFKASTGGEDVYVHKGKAKRYTGALPPDLAAAADLLVTMARIDRQVRKISPDEPWKADNAREWDGQTLESWLRKLKITDNAIELMDVFLNIIYGGDARDASLLFSLWYFAMFGDEHTPGRLTRGLAAEGGAQDSRFIGGSQILSIRMSEQLDGCVRLGAPVRRIAQQGNHVTVDSDAGNWQASRVIVAVPPVLASRIVWEPLLPSQQDQLLQRLPFGTLMKVEAIYPEPFWRADGLSGTALLRDGTPIQSMFDNTPPDGAPGVLMGFIGGREWRKWAPRPARERRDAVLRCFAQVVGPRAADTIDYVEQDWAAEQWTLGGPTSVAAPGVLTGYGDWLGRPFGRVHWAGAETARHWNGYMDGAVSSGKRAAQEVLEQL